MADASLTLNDGELPSGEGLVVLKWSRSGSYPLATFDPSNLKLHIDASILREDEAIDLTVKLRNTLESCMSVEDFRAAIAGLAAKKPRGWADYRGFARREE